MRGFGSRSILFLVADGWGSRLSQDGAPDALSLQADEMGLQRTSDFHVVAAPLNPKP